MVGEREQHVRRVDTDGEHEHRAGVGEVLHSQRDQGKQGEEQIGECLGTDAPRGAVPGEALRHTIRSPHADQQHLAEQTQRVEFICRRRISCARCEEERAKRHRQQQCGHERRPEPGDARPPERRRASPIETWSESGTVVQREHETTEDEEELDAQVTSVCQGHEPLKRRGQCFLDLVTHMVEHHPKCSQNTNAGQRSDVPGPTLVDEGLGVRTGEA